LQETFRTEIDVTQSIGKRYRRQDEIGTPYCITVDFDSLDDKSVTVRNRDSMEQERIAIDDLLSFFSDI
jgi:glycyl-tRNA synthetase